MKKLFSIVFRATDASSSVEQSRSITLSEINHSSTDKESIQKILYLWLNSQCLSHRDSELLESDLYHCYKHTLKE